VSDLTGLRPCWVARVSRAGSSAGSGTGDPVAKSTLCLACTLQRERNPRNHVTRRHNMRILCRTGRESVLMRHTASQPAAPKSRHGYSRLRRRVRAAFRQNSSRDTGSTRGVDLAERAVVAQGLQTSELGPGYRLLYSPVGKLPASFRSIEAAASGGPLAFR
jgi:hypothetical protein